MVKGHQDVDQGGAQKQRDDLELSMFIVDAHMRSEPLMVALLDFAVLAKKAHFENIKLVFPPLLLSEASNRSLTPALTPEHRRKANLVPRLLDNPKYKGHILLPGIFHGSPDQDFIDKIRLGIKGEKWKEIVEGGKEGHAKEDELKELLRRAREKGEFNEDDLQHFPNLDKPLKGQLGNNLVLFACYADSEIRSRLKLKYFDHADFSVCHFAKVLAEAQVEYEPAKPALIVASVDKGVKEGIETVMAQYPEARLGMGDMSFLVTWLHNALERLDKQISSELTGPQRVALSRPASLAENAYMAQTRAMLAEIKALNQTVEAEYPDRIAPGDRSSVPKHMRPGSSKTVPVKG